LVWCAIIDDGEGILGECHRRKDDLEGHDDPFFDHLRLRGVQSLSEQLVVPLNDPCFLARGLVLEADVVCLSPIYSAPAPHAGFFI